MRRLNMIECLAIALLILIGALLVLLGYGVYTAQIYVTPVK